MTPDRLFVAAKATWPPAAVHRSGPWTIRRGVGGGSRVSCATIDDVPDDAAMALLESAMRDLGQVPLAMVRGGQGALDAALAARGYAVSDPVTAWCAPVATLATGRPPPGTESVTPPGMARGTAPGTSPALPPGLPPETPPVSPPVTAFSIWPPLAIQAEIWATGDIGPARLAVMARVTGPRVALLGRVQDAPAATAFVACDGDVAMLHALVVLAPARRQGLGRCLLHAAAVWARAQGAAHLAVLVTQANTAANALYATAGMTAVTQYHYRTAPR